MKRFIRQLAFIKPLIIISVAVLIVAIIFLTRPTSEKAKLQEQSWPVSALTAQIKDAHPQLLLQGRIESPDTTILKSAVTAYVQTFPGQVGHFVPKGEIILTLDPIDATLDLKQKEAEVNRIEAELAAENNRQKAENQALKESQNLVNILTNSVNRQKTLEQKKLGSQANIDEAEQALVREKILLTERALAVANHQARIQELRAQLARAIADRDLAKLNASRTNIRSPFPGIISKKFVSIGDRVQPNTDLLEIYNRSNLEIRAQVPTSRIQELQTNIDNDIHIPAEIMGYANHIDIVLDRISGEIKPSQGGIDAFFKINHDKPPLRIGQAKKIKVILPMVKDVIAVPITAIFEREDGSYIFKILEDKGVSRLQAIKINKIGEQYFDQTTQVLLQAPSLRNGDHILVTRLPYARDNLKVVVDSER